MTLTAATIKLKPIADFSTICWSCSARTAVSVSKLNARAIRRLIFTTPSRTSGDKRGINRYADVVIPMDESLILCAVDISGRGVLNYQLNIPSAKVYDGDAVEKQKAVGLFDTELIEEFFLSFVREAKITLHIVQLYGKNTHHIIECAFKAVARALKTAVAITGNAIPSSKGIL